MSGSSSRRRTSAARTRRPAAKAARGPAQGAARKRTTKKAAKRTTKKAKKKKTTKKAAKKTTKTARKKSARKAKKSEKGKPAVKRTRKTTKTRAATGSRASKPRKKAVKKTKSAAQGKRTTPARATPAKRSRKASTANPRAAAKGKTARTPKGAAAKRRSAKPKKAASARTANKSRTTPRARTKSRKHASPTENQESMKKAETAATRTDSKKAAPKTKAKAPPKQAPGKTKAVEKPSKAAGSSKKRRKARTPREKKPRAPAKTMTAPKPVTTVLIEPDLPDVRRARAANVRREGARGHLQPASSEGGDDAPATREPLDASLIMNTLAVDVQPKIEDNYDYTVLDEFRSSPHCPRPTRMVNSGCGGGEAAVYFAKLGFQCVGIDPDRGDVGLARERAWLAGVEIDFMVGDLFETPNLLPAESFGLAVDRGAFYQIENERERQRYLANIKRLLFKGGVFLLSAGFFPVGDAGKRPKTKSVEILLAREGGVVVNEMRQAGFALLHRVLRQTADSGELGELVLYLRK